MSITLSWFSQPGQASQKFKNGNNPNRKKLFIRMQTLNQYMTELLWMWYDFMCNEHIENIILSFIILTEVILKVYL